MAEIGEPDEIVYPKEDEYEEGDLIPLTIPEEAPIPLPSEWPVPAEAPA